jgi:hypothetical protein
VGGNIEILRRKFFKKSFSPDIPREIPGEVILRGKNVQNIDSKTQKCPGQNLVPRGD